MEHKTHNMEQGTWNKRQEGEPKIRSSAPCSMLRVPCSMLHAPRTTGFALLFAVLATSVLLAVSASIWNIAMREVILSSFGRESQVAFFAADSGLECALYWDLVNNSFATSTGPVDISCGGTPSSFSVGGGGLASPTSYIGNPSDPSQDLLLTASATGPCVLVSVTKEYSGTRLVTTARAYGYNTCNPLSPTRVERGLLVTY